ncbi:hypothetical protein TrLO_g4845 [Triparma laevis f. longispina]|uniref:EF-hand domain-containing protein n=1 Tax=Triparma laevis f. longispina TaxID=1714387 RepID=A0A9W7KYR0_9STRA|nr:hypothetical protein TrLO_g4845 [Triparma laevis f. longispina]
MEDIMTSTLGNKYDHTGGQTSAAENASVVIISASERRKRFGIECTGPFGDGITFSGGTWVPGGEYVQTLVVKNVSTKMKKLKYRLPCTRFFSLLYPLEINLSPGTTQEFEVFFRPTRSEPYLDTIYFKMQEGADSGGFHVPVRAFIPTLQASVVPGLDMGLLPINVETAQSIFIHNTGEVPCPYEWKVPPPFTFTPDSGTIEVGSSHEIVCTIKPTSAEVFVGNAVCKVGEGVNATKPVPRLETRLSAVAKYPYIVASEHSVNFNEVVVNCNDDFQIKRELVVRNQSVVPAAYKILRIESDRSPVFDVQPNEGIIPPGSEVNLVVRYAPVVAGTFSAETYQIVTPGGNKEIMKFSGRCMSPVVRMYKKADPFQPGVPNSLNFRDAHVGDTVSRVLFLKNESERPCAFCFITDDNGIFKFNKTRGVIPANFETSVLLSFTPAKPGNFYRRIFCLIEDALPQFIDCLGSGYIDARGEIKEQRPAPLRHAHVQAFKNRVAAGLGKIGPAELEEMYRVNKMSKLFAGVGPKGTQALATSQAALPVTRSGEATRNEVAVAAEFFCDVDDKRGEIVLSSKEVDFGFTQGGARSMSQTIGVKNNCKEKVTVNWFIPKPEDGDTRLDFEVSPAIMDILPGKRAEFQVFFKPSSENFYYCQDLEAVVFFKSQRSFRLVTDATLQPPWNLTMRALGHSFNFEQFLPKISTSIKGNFLTFPSTFVGDKSFQTFRITNNGNLPAQFAFENDASSSFSVKPWGGLIPANDFQLVTVSFKPKQNKQYKSSLSCILNNTPSMAQKIRVVGEGSVPRIEVENTTKCGSLYLKPTCVGLASTRTLVVHNPTRIPLVFRASLPHKLDGTILDVSPRSARLLGNERTTITVTYAPRTEKTYRCKLHLKVRPLAGEAPDNRDARQIGQAEPSEIIQSLGVTLVCPGGAGAVSFDPPQLDFGVKLVNYSETRELRLINGSDCDLKYQILHHLIEGPPGSDPRLLGAHIPIKKHADPNANNLMIMDKPFGILPARSKLRTKVTFSPSNHGGYKFEMICKVGRVDENGFEKMVSPEEAGLLQRNAEARVDAGYDGNDVYLAGLPGTSAEEKKDDGSFMPLKINLVGSASFPTVVFRDVRVERGGFGLGCSSDQMYGQLGLELINKTLATPLTRQEVEYNLLSSPDLSKLPTFNLPFTPAPLKSPEQVLFLELRNPAHLPVKFSIHLPNEKSIELETWADEGEPTEEEVKINKIIDEIKCFDVFPREGELKSGESMTVRVSYKYNNLEYGGRHELPLLLRIFQGKQFWVKCIGRTLEKEEPCLLPRTVNGLTSLYPVAMGTRPHEAPLQVTELMNVSGRPFDYKVDMKAVAKFNEENGYGLELLKLENPSGRIASFKSVMLRWRFLPLEAKLYELDLPVKMIDGKNVVKSILKFSCKGYDPRDWSVDPHRVPVPHTDVGALAPPEQYIDVPSQEATLSIDRLIFGRMPQRSTITKMSIIKNTTQKPIRFNLNNPDWYTENANDDSASVVHVYPSEGMLEPGKQQLLKVTINASAYPRIINKTIAVQLMVPQMDMTAKVTPSAQEDKDSERMMKLTKKVGDNPHESVSLGETLSRVGAKVQTAISKCGKLGYDDDKRQEILNEVYLLLTETAAKSTLGEKFLETVIMKLIKVGMKDDIDELALEGTAQARSLDQMMEELEETYKKKRKEPEIKLAFMLYGLDTENLPTPTKAPKLGAKGGTGKVSFTESMGTQSSSTSLPSTGLRGTLVMPRGNNKARASETLGKKPTKTFLFLHVQAEIVEEEPFFGVFGGDLKESGVRIPTARAFVENPTEVVPARFVPSKDGFITDDGRVGKFGGPKEAAAVKGLVTAMFTELVSSNDLVMQMDELPKNPRNPYLGEVQKRPPLMTSLQAAFDLFDVDASGTLTNNEVTSALRHIGLSHKDASVKKFLKELDKDGDNEVDMREFLGGLTPDIAHKIVHALETNEDMIVTMRAERQKILEGMKSPAVSPRSMQRQMSQQAVALGLVENEEEIVEVEETEELNSAALMIQKRQRIRKAKEKVNQKRFLATAEGTEMNSAALMIQGRQRQRKAKAELRKQAEIKKKHKLEEASQREDLREFVPRILNETLFNLLREAMETPLNDSMLLVLEEQMENLRAREMEGEEVDEDEVYELKQKVERLMSMPRFDLNLKPKTFVRSLD